MNYYLTLIGRNNVEILGSRQLFHFNRNEYSWEFFSEMAVNDIVLVIDGFHHPIEIEHNLRMPYVFQIGDTLNLYVTDNNPKYIIL